MLGQVYDECWVVYIELSMQWLMVSGQKHLCFPEPEDCNHYNRYVYH